LHSEQQFTPAVQHRSNLLYYQHPGVAEPPVLTLFVILLIFGLTLGVALFVGGLFVQGYIYTEPSAQLRWGAPVTAAVLFLFVTFWSLIVVFSGSTPTDIPFDVIWRFSPKVDKFQKPVSELTAIRKGGKSEVYKLHKTVPFAGAKARSEYKSVRDGKPWNGDGVEEIVIKTDEGDMRFERVPEKQREQGEFPKFITSDDWVMTVYDNGPTDSPRKFRYGRFIANFFLNFLHLALWFVCLWLLMRFELFHALVGAFAIWLVCTLIILPMVLDFAAGVSQARQGAAPAATQITADRSRLG
jgi:hypothetical protein